MTAVSHILPRWDVFAAAKRHPLATFIVSAYGLSWGMAVPLALRAQGLLDLALPWWMHYFTAYGPLLAALLVTRMLDGPAGVQTLWERVCQWRIGWGWFVFAAFSPVVLFWRDRADRGCAGRHSTNAAPAGDD